MKIDSRRFHAAWVLMPAIVLALLAPGLGAQSLHHLMAERYEAAAGQRLRIHFERETNQELTRGAWPERIHWTFVRAGGGQRNLTDLSPAEPGQDFVELDLTLPGITLIGTDAAPRIEEVSGHALAAFLGARIPADRLPVDWREGLGDEPVRLRRLESNKLLLRVVGPEGWLPNSATAQSKSGQRAEIRPLADPTSARLKSDLPLRIYLPDPRNQGKQGTRVIAHHLESGRSQSFLTDREGTGFFTVSVGGLWTVEAHHARPLGPKEEADWELVSTMLTFEAPHWDPRDAEQGKERR